MSISSKSNETFIDQVIQQDENGDLVGFTIQELNEEDFIRATTTTQPVINPPPHDPKKLFVYSSINPREEENHFCDVCNDCFINLETLLMHKTIHEETVLCEFCHVKIMKKSLPYHMSAKHPSKCTTPPAAVVPIRAIFPPQPSTSKDPISIKQEEDFQSAFLKSFNEKKLKINEIHENFQENVAIIIENPRTMPPPRTFHANVRKKMTHANLRRVLEVKKKLQTVAVATKVPFIPIPIVSKVTENLKAFPVRKIAPIVRQPIVIYPNYDEEPPARKVVPTRQKSPPKTFEFACVNCSKTFTNQQALKIHQSFHEDKKSCKICGIKISSRVMAFHMSVMHKNAKKPELSENIKNPFKCGICGECFAVTNLLEKHMASHERMECDQCGMKVFKMGFEQHMKQHPKRIDRFSCIVCKANFATWERLEEHKKCHGGGKIVYSINKN